MSTHRHKLIHYTAAAFTTCALTTVLLAPGCKPGKSSAVHEAGFSTDPMAEAVLRQFTDLSAVSRCSRQEIAMSDYLMAWARRNKFQTHAIPVPEHVKSSITEEMRQDPSFNPLHIGYNVIVTVPGTNGMESAPPVALQSHQDMVCLALREDSQDRTARRMIETGTLRLDKIVTSVNSDERGGPWLTSDGNSTLGADNGVGMAIMMVMATDHTNPHPPLELVFSIDEESGFSGASNLRAADLRARRMINLDSEEEGIVTIGSAGGNLINFTLPLGQTQNAQGSVYVVRVSDMAGGHSGLEISRKGGNALRVLAETLTTLQSRLNNAARLVSFAGGTKMNAIPAGASATIVVPPQAEKILSEAFVSVQQAAIAKFKATDPKIKLELVKQPMSDAPALDPAAAAVALSLVGTYPHGVKDWDSTDPRFVITSDNWAKAEIVADQTGARLVGLSMQRGADTARLSAYTDSIMNHIRKIAPNASVNFKNGFPGWAPDWSSKLLQAAKELAKNTLQREATVDVIHAGLECGEIKNAYPNMEIISIGATMKDGHRLTERISIPSIGRTYRYTQAIMNHPALRMP